MTDALATVADRLACPHCRASVTVEPAAVACAHGHRFDRARGGGVTLLAPGAALPPGDSPAMLQARDAFLRGGHFAPLSAAIAAAVPTGGRCVVDAGAGTGWHTAAVLDARPGAAGIALDASRAATRRAARAHPRLAAVTCDVTARLPLRDGAADAVLSVFAPRHPSEFARVLAPGGALVVAAAAQDHLAEARRRLGLLGVQPEKRAKLHARLAPWFEAVALEQVRVELSLDRDALAQLVAMGPNAFHAADDEIAARVADAPAPMTVTVSVTVETFALRR